MTEKRMKLRPRGVRGNIAISVPAELGTILIEKGIAKICPNKVWRRTHTQPYCTTEMEFHKKVYELVEHHNKNVDRRRALRIPHYKDLRYEDAEPN